MKKAIYLYVTLCLLTILTGCGGGQMPRELQAVSSIINQHPDSALAMLDSMEAEKTHWNKDAQMRYELLRLKAQNKLFIDFPNDSLPRVLVDYFDIHGTRNDRVLARYMLGRAYHAMGDAPMALETYYDAISQADTLSPDCDLDALKGIYGQMSQIFHKQNLPHDELRALQQHIRITKLIGSEEEAIIAKGQLIKPYFLMDSLDLYLQNINDCYRDFMRMGNRKMAAETVGPAVPIYVWRGQLDKARELTKAILLPGARVIITARDSSCWPSMRPILLNIIIARPSATAICLKATKDCSTSTANGTTPTPLLTTPCCSSRRRTRCTTGCGSKPSTRCRLSTITAAVRNWLSRKQPRRGKPACGYGLSVFSRYSLSPLASMCIATDSDRTASAFNICA